MSRTLKDSFKTVFIARLVVPRADIKDIKQVKT